MSKKDKKISMIIDKREYNLIAEMRNLQDSVFNDLSIYEKLLDIGDVIVSDSLVIERKTRTDFENSVIDNRLFLQLAQMQSYAKRVLIIEGTEEYMRLHRNAILGAYAAIITKFNCSLIFTIDIRSTAEFIYYLAKHEQEEKHTIKLATNKRSFNDSQYARRIVESIPMIGPENAKELLTEFGTIKRIVNATDKELLQVRLLGRKKVNKLLQIFNHFYNPEEDT
ncbi:MAG: hypothetical protein N3E37_03690 [Candidatus Micrarchaeota archaeon]|nr:hypothetical protein [Candidatus Micrarchaeota archaeon]